VVAEADVCVLAHPCVDAFGEACPACPAAQALDGPGLHLGAQHAALGALLTVRPDVREGEPLIMAAVMDQAIGRLTRWMVHDAPASLDRATLEAETIELLCRYLTKGS